MKHIARNTRQSDYRSAAIGAGALLILGGVAVRWQRRNRRDPGHKIRQSATVMGVSILADSAMEHLRGGYHNPAMYAAPSLAALSTAGAARDGRAARAVHAMSIAAGTAGLGFHVWNILKRSGRMSWNNLFYAAPIGAPGGLSVTGILALAARAQTRSHGRLLAGFIGLATLAQVAEVALLHFRGAWHNPAMFLPVTIPPITAGLLLQQALRPGAATARLARGAICIMGAMGIVGTAFHIYGVSRNMGGWSNWRQSAFAGPPVPAPSSFVALALAGDAALDLILPGPPES